MQHEARNFVGSGELTLSFRHRKLFVVSTVAEIEAALPKLTTEELVKLEIALHQQYQQRGTAITHDDTYGVVTEADLIAEADQAFQAYDKEEASHAKPGSR